MTRAQPATAFAALPQTAAPDADCTVQACDLRRAVAFAALAVERRNAVPVLGTLRLRCAGGVLSVEGTDLDLQARMTALATGGDFAAALPPRFLADLLRAADPQAEVTLSRRADIITIAADGMTARLCEMSPVADWPELGPGKVIGDTQSAVVHGFDAAALRDALDATIDCVSTEETRFYLSGVFLHARAGKLVAVASDGHRLARHQSLEDWAHPDAILPIKAARILLRALYRAAGGVTVASLNRQMIFAGPGWELRTKTVDGDFPDTQRVIPSAAPIASVTLSAGALARLPSDRNHRYVTFDGAAGTMSTADTLIGSEVSLPVQMSGAPMAIAFNAGYLRGFLRRAGLIRIDLTGPRDAAVILSADPRNLFVLMPARL